MKTRAGALLFPLFFAVLPALAQKDSANNFVGGEACKTCHADVWSKFYKNPHFKSVASGKETPEHTGCESCHGETLARANIRRSSHTLAGVACTSCHSIHKSQAPKFLLAEKQPDTCYGCHADVRSQFSMPFKHRVNEGAMVCTDCHNPHGGPQPTWRNGERPRMMQQAMGSEEPCLKCHEEKRGPFVFEHPPVRVEGCEVCHYPHGSANSRLLRRPVVFTMCLECHNGALGFGRAGLGAPVPFQFHDLRSARYQNCTNCHSHIHGSNTSAFFLK